jgi:hypothetical protein
MVFEDATTRESSGSTKTLTIKTVSGTGVTVPSGAHLLVYSDATNVNLGLLNKGYLTVNSSTITAHTAVAGEQIFAITNTNPITITLPAAAVTGDEVTIIDGGNFFGSNNLTINRNSHKINAGTSNLVLNVNGQASTLVYANVTVGWVVKSTNQ